MLGSPSFHHYRSSNTGHARPAMELGSGLYHEDQPYSVRIIPVVFYLPYCSILFLYSTYIYVLQYYPLIPVNVGMEYIRQYSLVLVGWWAD